MTTSVGVIVTATIVTLALRPVDSIPDLRKTGVPEHAIVVNKDTVTETASDLDGEQPQITQDENEQTLKRSADSNVPFPPPAQRDSGREGRVRGGKLLSAARLKEEQVQEAKRLALLYPDSDDAAYLEGLIFHEQDRFPEALASWNRCQKLNPDRPDLCDFVGRVLVWTGRLDEAETMFRRALAIQASLLDTRIQLGETLLRQGKLQAVIDTLREDPRPHPKAYVLLGQAHRQLNEHEKAKEMFLQAVGIAPDMAEACYGLATTCARLNEPERSAEYFAKFRQLEAQAHQTVSDVQPAMDATRKRVAHTHTDAGRVYRTMANVQEAERLWRRAATLDPENIRCRDQLAQLCKAQGRLTDALRMYEEVSRIEPNRGVHFFNFGNMNLLLRRYDAAERAFNTVIELEPNRADGYQALAQCYLAANRNVQQTTSLAHRAAELSPTAPVYALLGLACERSGDTAAALKATEQAAKLEPANAEYRRRVEALRQRSR